MELWPFIDYATTTSITEALKRSVYDAIVQLSEVVSEKFLKTLLPFLHCTAWDEVVEERFLGNPRLCGFPTCNEVIIRREKKQRFHIDREARKIYENRMVRDMYCSRLCMLRSSSIRAQLADEPLWISGNIKKRISLPYITDATMVVNNMTSENVGIEIVNVVEEKLSDLRIRETEVSTSSDSEDDEECLTDVDSVHDLLDGNIDDKKDFNNERNQKLGADTDLSGGDSDKKMMKNSTKISCSSTFSIDKESVNKSGTLVNNQRLPDPQMSSNCSLTEAELEKLARLRSKYSGYAVKKPVVIEPRHCLRKQHGKESNVDAIVDCSDTQKTVELVWNLFRSDTVFMKFNSIGWITERTYHVLRYGSSHVSVSSFAIMDVSRESEIDHVCSDEIFLPTVDSLDVRKKRLLNFF
ncbi:hypothetical protein DICVIV_08156 [Dictyocaulus viviparus]|uniref:RNA polymerase II subunit B1 CTD phosphatase RPAP2 homolog n=1 Tax=Dictyocaulus viviparus TaxID=29172 RepID=A0A0D8XPY5_DICVI|nr:hypothetical protein DICVIV_08156 [Dictyocaulus viviparus]